MQKVLDQISIGRVSVLTTISSVADATALFYMNEKIKKYAEEVKGVKINYIPFVMKSVIASLRRHPDMNSVIEGNVLYKQNMYDLEIFGSVITSADRKDLFTIARELEFGTLHTPSTFAILPYGIKGEAYPTLIPSVSEVCVLGLSTIYNDISMSGNGLLSNKSIYLSLVFDSSHISYEEASGFMADLIMFIENPEISLLDN